jgi:hypothetical protein
MISKGRLLLLSPLLFILASGCGPTKSASASLSGKVAYKGNPVTGGTVTVFVKDGGAYPIPITPEGTYSGTDLPPGEVTVTIETESAKQKFGMGDYAKMKRGGGGGKEKGQMVSPAPEGFQPGAGGQYVKIPRKYSDKEKSGLSLALTRGKNTKDFDLTD